ncbi:hypothetical protein ACF1B0_29035 [Streptomyces anandii]|uniref:hypothetical protein n=1 Tax=Streptomyces anandii TaxID=285454 RepID=UPI0036F88233
MIRLIVRVAAGGLALADGMIHASVLHDHFRAALYMGILFVFAIVFLSMLGLAMVQPLTEDAAELPGRLMRAAGVALMAGLIAGYLITRTVGLPGFAQPWDDLGLSTLAIEFLIAVLLLAEMPVASASQHRHA